MPVIPIIDLCGLLHIYTYRVSYARVSYKNAGASYTCVIFQCHTFVYAWQHIVTRFVCTYVITLTRLCVHMPQWHTFVYIWYHIDTRLCTYVITLTHVCVHMSSHWHTFVHICLHIDTRLCTYVFTVTPFCAHMSSQWHTFVYIGHSTGRHCIHVSYLNDTALTWHVSCQHVVSVPELCTRVIYMTHNIVYICPWKRLFWSLLEDSCTRKQ